METEAAHPSTVSTEPKAPTRSARNLLIFGAIAFPFIFVALLLGQVSSSVATSYSADLNTFMIFNFFAALIIGLLPAAFAVRDIFRIHRNPPTDTTFRMASGGSFAIAITGIIIAALGASATAPAALSAWESEARQAQIRSAPPTAREQWDVQEVAADMTTLLEGGLRTLGIDPAGRVKTTIGPEPGERTCTLSNLQEGTWVSVSARVHLPELPTDEGATDADTTNAGATEATTAEPRRYTTIPVTYWAPLEAYWGEQGFRILIPDETEPSLHAIVDEPGQLHDAQLSPASEAIRSGRAQITDLSRGSANSGQASSGAELSLTMISSCVVDPER